MPACVLGVLPRDFARVASCTACNPLTVETVAKYANIEEVPIGAYLLAHVQCS